MTIGERIKQRRIELGMSQEELAKKMGYTTRNAIYQFEKKDNMKLSLIEKFAEALDTTPAYLMGWEDLGEELARQTQPIADALSAFSSQLQISTEELAKVIELYKQIEVLPKDKQIELKKYLRFLQSDL